MAPKSARGKRFRPVPPEPLRKELTKLAITISLGASTLLGGGAFLRFGRGVLTAEFAVLVLVTAGLGVGLALFMASSIERKFETALVRLHDVILHLRQRPDHKKRVRATGPRELVDLGHDLNELLDVFQARIKAHQREADELVGRVDAQQRELREAMERAVATTQARSQFLANMSHELRTPLNGIMGMTELLKDTNLSSEQEEYASTVLESGETLLRIIDDVLDFSKLETGKLEVEHLPYDLVSVLQEVCASAEASADRKGIRVRHAFARDLPAEVFGDPSRVRQIVQALLENAVKFTAKGQVVLRARLGQDARERDRLEIEVEDTGIGIPNDQLERMFASFTQMDSSSTREHGGAGLGLNVGRRLAAIMGGDLQAESEVGKGSRFRLLLPLEDATPETVAAKAPTGGRTRHRGTALVAVEDPAERSFLVSHLSSAGFDVQFVEAGPLAVLPSHLRDKELVLMTIPSSSPEVLRHAEPLRREASRLHYVPVLGILDPMDESGRELALAAGVDDILARPLSAKELEETVDRWVRPAVAS